MKMITSIILLFQSTFLVAQNQPKGLFVNDKAPNFSAKDQNDKLITLNNQVKKNTVVLIFYRGEWCPFCNKELKSIEDSLSFITAKGAVVLAVSPEKYENIAKTVIKTKASYSILHDDGLKIMKSYDVAFAVDSVTISRYKAYGIDFANANGENGASLPVPAVYIINKQGKIIFRYFDADYRKRPSVKELLSHL